MEIIKSPYVEIIADIVKNNKNLTPKLQDAIATWLEYESTPITTIVDQPLNIEIIDTTTQN